MLMKAETLKRRKLERKVEQALTREAYEQQVYNARMVYPDLPTLAELDAAVDNPTDTLQSTNQSCSFQHADGSFTVITSNRFIHF